MSLRDALAKRAIKFVNEQLEYGKEQVDKRIPIKSGDLKRSTKVENAQVVGDSVIGKITNDSSYALFVEEGTAGPYNAGGPKIDRRYHRNGRVFLGPTNEGARMFTFTRQDIIKRING